MDLNAEAFSTDDGISGNVDRQEHECGQDLLPTPLRLASGLWFQQAGGLEGFGR